MTVRLITHIPSLQLKDVCNIREKGNVACEDNSTFFLQYFKIKGMSVFEFVLKHISPFSEGKQLPLLFCI